MNAAKSKNNTESYDQILITKSVTINNRGQIVIPKNIRDRLELATGNVLQVVMLASKTIVMRKIMEIPISTFLEENKDILKLALESYEKANNDNTADEGSINPYIRNSTDEEDPK